MYLPGVGGGGVGFGTGLRLGSGTGLGLGEVPWYKMPRNEFMKEVKYWQHLRDNKPTYRTLIIGRQVTIFVDIVPNIPNCAGVFHRSTMGTLIIFLTVCFMRVKSIWIHT